MRDRTHEFRENDDDSDSENAEHVALVVQPGSAKPMEPPDPTDEFFRTTRGIREALKMLESKVKDLEKHQTTILATPLPEDSMKQDLQKLREDIKVLAKDIRTRLKSECGGGGTLMGPTKDEEDENRNAINTRMKRTQHGILSQQFLELINKCNSTQSDYRDRNLERIRRQLQITGSGGVSEEELDQMLESGQTEVFVSNVSSEKWGLRREKAGGCTESFAMELISSHSTSVQIMKDTQMTKQALNEIETRHSEILKLERSIQELHEMFTYLATEVELQGEMIDRIEKNILDSEDYVKKGQQHLHTAQENQKKARKKKFMIGICLTVTVVIILIIIGAAIAAG
ncbi:hypothetical protein lerEdw1_013182 [Lerista edwardsae]|nr:hypothetical protein lerEdw1_013182 [Lerista edwardsae]